MRGKIYITLFTILFILLLIPIYADTSQKLEGECVKLCEQLGVELVTVIPDICKVWPLFEYERVEVVKLASPLAFAVILVTAVWTAPFIV